MHITKSLNKLVHDINSLSNYHLHLLKNIFIQLLLNTTSHIVYHILRLNHLLITFYMWGKRKWDTKFHIEGIFMLEGKSHTFALIISESSHMHKSVNTQMLKLIKSKGILRSLSCHTEHIAHNIYHIYEIWRNGHINQKTPQTLIIPTKKVMNSDIL